MVILCLFPSKAFAELGLIKTPDGHVRLAGVISSRPNGIITAKVIGGNYVHGTAESLSLRSATSGAVSSAKVPATISRTASLAKVAQNIHGKLRYARFTPQGLVGSLILGEIINSLIEEGYTYDEATGEMVNTGATTLLCAASSGPCFESYVSTPTFSKNEWAVRATSGSNPTPQQINDLLCSKIGKQHFNFSDHSALSDPTSHRYNLATNECIITFNVLKPIGNLSPGKVLVQKVLVQTRTIDPHALTAAEFQRILEPIAAQNPEAVLQAADLSDSDWSAPKVHVLPGTIVNSQPFTDPKDGKAKQARWEFYDCEDGQSCVKETLTDRPDLQPNSPAAPAPDNPPANGTDTAPGSGSNAGNNTGSGNQSGNESQQEKDDLCRKYPHIMACDEQPEPNDYDLKIPKETVNLDFRPDNVFPTGGQCPAPVQWHFNFMGVNKTFGFSLQYVCDIGSQLRPILIAFAFLVAGFFCIRVVARDV